MVGVQYKKAMHAITSNGIGEVSERVFQELLSKHAQVDLPTPSSDFSAPSTIISEMEILRALIPFLMAPSQAFWFEG